jgi:nitroreductase
MTLQNDALRIIHSLRSTHGNFTGQEISDADLRMILDAAVRAPNASARQSYSIVVVQDRERMKQLCGYEGSKALVFCIDYTRISDTAAHLGHPFAAGGFVSFVTGSTDTI